MAFETPENAPNVPSAQTVTPTPINYPDWSFFGQTEGGAPDPYDYFRIQNQITKQGIGMYPSLVQSQLSMMPQITAAQMAASQQAFPLQLQQQQQASQAAFEEQMRQFGIAGPQIAQQNWGLTQQYAPQYNTLLNQQAGISGAAMQGMSSQYNPQFMPTYNALGQQVQQGLEAGYNLGPGLEHEMEQSIRAGQAARGSTFGPALTAEEVFGKGQASIDLYNQRQAAAQGFLQGRQPTELWGSMAQAYGSAGTSLGMPMQGQPQTQLMSGMATPTAQTATQLAANSFQPPNVDYASQSGQAYGMYMGALGTWGGTYVSGQSNYNQAQIAATSVNNEGTFNTYDRQFEQFLFQEAVNNGLYSTPSTGGSGAMQMAGQVGGAAIGAVGAAAAGAAAAICWLAREIIPDQWREFRRFLFTKAPAWFRRKYLFGARRLVMTLDDAGKVEIAEVMRKCLQ